MKTLSLALGLMLLLFTVQHCTATVALARIPPDNCCFDFFPGVIPRRKITSIGVIDSRCPEPAFLITTTRGKELCVRLDAHWAQRVYEELNPTSAQTPSEPCCSNAALPTSQGEFEKTIPPSSNVSTTPRSLGETVSTTAKRFSKIADSTLQNYLQWCVRPSMS